MQTVEERKAKYLIWLEEVMALQPSLRQELADEFGKRLSELMVDCTREVGGPERQALLANIADKERVAIAWMNLCKQAEQQAGHARHTTLLEVSTILSKEHPQAAVAICKLAASLNPQVESVPIPPQWQAFNKIPAQARIAEPTVYLCDKCRSVFGEQMAFCIFCRNKSFIPGTMTDFGIVEKKP